MELLQKTLDEEEPWAAFSQQEPLWQGDTLRRLIEDWPKRAAEQLSIGDATIKDVADFYARMGEEVVIVTSDRGLKAYQPATPPRVPRRRR